MKKTMYHHHAHQPPFPCLHCHPHSYIRMVQHLIERCLTLHMSQDQCIKTLAEHASIRPLVTRTVWRELQKENRDFFRAYFHSITPRTLMRRLAGHPGLQRGDNGNGRATIYERIGSRKIGE